MRNDEAILMMLNGGGGGGIPTDFLIELLFSNNYNETNGNNLTNTGGSFITDRKGAANSALNANISTLMQTTNNVTYNSNKITVSCWIKIVNGGVNKWLVSSGNVGSENTFELIYVAPNIVIGNGSSLGYNYRLVDTAIVGNTWTNVIAEFDNSQGTIAAQNRAWINNVESTTTTWQGYAQLQPNNNFTTNKLGVCTRINALLPFNDYIDNIRVYNRLTTAEEKTSLYNE